MKIKKTQQKKTFRTLKSKAEKLKKLWAFFLLFSVIFSQSLAPLALASSNQIQPSDSFITEQFAPQQILLVDEDSSPLKWSGQEKSLVSELGNDSSLEKFSLDNSTVLIFTNTTTPTNTETQIPETTTSETSSPILAPDNSENFLPNPIGSTTTTTELQLQTLSSEEILTTLPETASATEQSNIILLAPEEIILPETTTQTAQTIPEPDIISTSSLKEILPEPEKQLSSPALEYSRFIINGSDSEFSNLKNPDSAKIKLSFASLPISSGQLSIEYSLASSSWQTLSSISLNSEDSNAKRGGAFFANLPQAVLGQLSELNIRLKITAPETAWTNISSTEFFFLDAVWLEADYKTISPEEEEDQLANQQLGNLTPEEFAHLEFFSPLMELFMPADLSTNPITLGSNKSGFNSLPLQMLPVNVSTATPATRLGQKVVYTDAYKSTDLEYIMSDSGLKENIILKAKNHPTKFRYVTNLDKYDSVQTSPSTIVLYAKGHKGQILYKRYTLSAPIMIDSQGNESSQLEFKVNKNLITLIPDTSWLKTASYPVTVDPNVDLSILNVSSFPVAGEFWTIGFTTVGQDNLTITPGDQATIDDMEFSSLTCDGSSIIPSVSFDGQVNVNNWSCDGIGEIKFLDKKTGHHHMAFAFGEASQDAYNGANTWNGLAGDSNWATGGNWSLGTPPALADDVVISSAATININSSASINSLVIGNSGGGVASVLNFNYDASASPLSIVGDMTVYSGANITQTTGATTTVISRINISAGGNATITGSINADSKGYTADKGTGAGTLNNQAGGGSYGGIGGSGAGGAIGGIAYGSSTVPTSLGSGGGSSTCGSPGGAGGGAIQLNVTGTTTISGTISANGGAGASNPCWRSGGGSGGSVYITTGVLAGSGSITAIGGNGVNGVDGSGNGGGGRIAVKYTTDSSTATYSVYSGTGGYSYGGSGTIFKKSSGQTYGDLTLDNNNYGSTNELAFGRTTIPSSTFDSILIKNSASAFTASSATSTTLTLSNNGHYNALSGSTLYYSSLNWSGIVTDSGGILPVLNQNQDLTIATTSKITFNVANGTRTYNNIIVNGTLTHSYNSSATSGTASLYKINWTANGNFTIGSSGTVNVDARGFVGGQGLGVGVANNQAGGGGYGGKGGAGPTGAAGGVVNGSTSTPVSLGSGGGNTLCGSIGGSGGGAVQFNVTGTTTILGNISANGGNGASSPCWNAGGGSGGSIYITTNVLTGSGTVSANGGNGIGGGSPSGDGGGGRIAILTTTNTASLTRQVIPGVSYSAGSPGVGTTYPNDFTVLSTQSVTDNNTGTSVTGNGTISSIGYHPITQFGHVWSTWANPYVPNTNIATTSTGGTSFASKVNQGAIAYAFDGVPSTYWGSSEGFSYDLEYDFPTTTVVNKYIVTAHTSPGDSPRDWQFQAWDGGSWINLQSVSSQTGWGAYESRAFTLVNTTPYSKYRLYISGNNGGGWTRVAEIQLFNTGGSMVTNGATSTPGVFTSSITGLTPNTTYHTRSYATTPGGTTYGDDVLFSTGTENNSPNAPSSLGPNSFTTNTWGTTTTPTLTFNLSDPEVADTVKYKIILDNDSNFASPLISYTSALGAQGSASFTVGQVAGSGSYTIGSAGQTLPDNSSYYWEVQAIDSSTASSAFSVANSGSIAFKVDTTNPTVGTMDIFAVSPTQFYITGIGFSDSGTGIASYLFTNTTTSASSGSIGNGWNNSGLIPNTYYAYRMSATDGVGLTSATATGSAYTLANVPVSPTTTVISNSSILLSWDNNSNSAGTEYYAENSTSAFNSGWVTGTSTLFTGLTCGTSYTFHVKARNASGTQTAYSTSVSPSASPCNNNPGAPSSLGYGQYTNSGWVNNPNPNVVFVLYDSDASDTVKYRIQFATSSDFSALVIDYSSALLSQGEKNFTVGQATSTGSYTVGFAGQTLADNANGYYWRVMATDNSLATSAWVPAASGAVAFKLETVAPSAGSLTLTDTTTNSVTLLFGGGSDGGSGLTATPYVYYNTTNWNNSGNTAATTWTNSALTGGTYSYKVRVTDIAGNYTEVPLASSVTVTGDGGGGGGDPWVGDSTQGFSVFINQNDSITNTQNVTLQLTGQPGTTQMLISNLANFAGASLEAYNTTKFWDLCLGLGSCTNGTYSVYAKFYNALSQSSGSVSDNITYQILNSLTPGSLSLTSISTSTASILISGSADAVYGLAVNPYTFKNRNTGIQSATSSTSSWINTGLNPNTQYSYYAIVGNANSTFGNTSDISAYTLANPPTNLATTTISTTAIGLTWNNNSNPAGTEYQVYNQTSGLSSSWITSTSTTISGLTCAVAYDFKVKARNANGTETAYTSLLTENTSSCPSAPPTPPSGGGGGGGPTVPPVDILPVPALICPAPGENQFSQCFYNSMNFSSLVAIGTTGEINYDWGYTAPDPNVRTDNFSARWAGNFNFSTALYQFTATSDDGVRVYVDDQLLIDQWNNHPATTYQKNIRLPGGKHYVQMDFYDNFQHAVAKLSWQKITPPATPITQIPTPPAVVPQAPEIPPAPPAPIPPAVTVILAPPAGTVTPPTPSVPPKPIPATTPVVELPKVPAAENPSPIIYVGGEIKILAETVIRSAITESKQLLLASSFPLKSFFDNFVKIKNSQNTAVGISVLTIAPASLYLEYSLASHGLNINAAGSFTEIWLRLLQWLYALMAATGLRKKRRYWGTVYDSENKQPLDPALVDLIDPLTGKVLEQNITDMYGRFGFLDRPGKFFIRAAKTNYRFPSEIVSGKTDLMFENLYHGELLEISSDKGIITPNIPMDPMAFDWNQMDKQRVVKINPRLEYALHIILQTLFWSGAMFVLLNFLLLPNLFNSISVLVYLVMIVMRRIIPHAHLWGRIVFNSGLRANHLLLELHPIKIPSVVTGRAVSAESGKFFLKAMPGKYVLTIKKVDGLTNTILYKQDVTVGKDGVVNEIITL